MENTMFKKMDDVQIEINKMTNLKMVNLYEVTGASFGEGCNAISVFYGDDGKFNLLESDVHYKMLVDRVLELYNLSEDKEMIMMDNDTRILLENGIGISHEACLEPYYNMTGLDCPIVPLESMMGENLIPLVEYLIIGIYKTFGYYLEIINRKIGWRGSGTLMFTNGTNNINCYVNIHQTGNKKYNINVTNFLDFKGVLSIEVLFENDRIELLYYSKNYKLHGKGLYYFTSSKMIENHETYYNGQQIFMGNEEYNTRETLPNTDLRTEELNVLIDEKNIVAIYRLPWMVTYVLSEEKTEYQNTIHYRYRASYIFGDGKYSDIRGYTKILNKYSNICLKTESMNLKKYYLDDAKVETYFDDIDNKTLGEYKQHLACKYFVTDIK